VFKTVQDIFNVTSHDKYVARSLLLIVWGKML